MGRFPHGDTLDLIDASYVLLLRAAQIHRPLTMPEMSRCFEGFDLLFYPSLRIDLASHEKKITPGGYYYSGLENLIGSLEEFGYSERLASHTLLGPIGIEELNDRFPYLFHRSRIKSIYRRSFNDFVLYIDQWLAGLEKLRAEQVRPEPSVISHLLGGYPG